MTILSKVKTLIEYAKFGMFYVQASNYDEKADRLKPLHFPKGVKHYDSGLIQYATALTGHLKQLGYGTGNGYAKNNTTIEYINLPKLTSIAGWGSCQNMYALKECRLPSLRNLECAQLVNCGNLEIFEVGSLVIFSNSGGAHAMSGNSKVHTFIVGKDTSCSLYLHYCPLLTQECLHNIIDNVADRKGTSTLTLTVHQEAYDRISEEYKTKLSNKNWNLAIGS